MEKNIIQFERMLKNIIYNEYEKYLPKSKKELLKKNINLINPNKYNSDDKEFQCLIIRNIFKFIINANCKKTIEINDHRYIVEYGEYLTNGLIEFYTSLICKKYEIEYIKDPKFNENYDFIFQINDYIDLNKYAFKENAEKLLTSIQFDVFKNRYDNYIKKDFLRKVALKSNYNSIEKISEVFIVYINGNIAIKIIDNLNNSHIIKLDCPCDEVVIFTYMDNINEHENNIYRFFKLLKQKDVDFIDYDEFFGNVLEEYGVEEAIPEVINIDDKINDSNFYNEYEILASNGEITKEKEVFIPKSVDYPKEIKKEESSTVLKNEIIPNIIEIKDEKLKTIKEEITKKEIKPEEVISASEYEKICMKAVKGKQLTDEDYQKIAIFDTFHYGKTNETKIKNYETKLEKNIDNQIQKRTKKKMTFLKKLIIFFIIILTIAIGIYLGKILFDMVNR